MTGDMLPQATQSRCRCQSRKPCTSPALPNSLFCMKHRNCRQSPTSNSEPVYNPDRYNKDPKIQGVHNCWSYGMDVVDPTQLNQCAGAGECEIQFHQPGGTKGKSKILTEARGRTCKTVDKLIRADVPELRRTTFRKRCKKGTSKIALVTHKGEDYHFYRQDSDGMWSHKPGSKKVERIDAEGRPIWDPKTAARNYRQSGSILHYKDFCGYYCVPRRRTIKLSR